MKKSTRFLLLAALASATVCVIAGNIQASTIAVVEAQSSGSAATLNNSPVITYIASQPGSGDGYTYSNYAILANDGTGSIDIFGHLPTGSTYVPTVGDAISATGTFSPFNNIPELATLTAISQVSTGNSVPGPTVVTIPQMLALSTVGENLAIQEYLLELDDVTFVTTGTFPVHANLTTTVTDGSNTLTVFFNPSSYSVSDPLAGTAIPTGPVNIVGIASVFGGTYTGTGGTAELLPFTITPVPEPASLTLSLLALGGVALLSRRRRVV